MTQESPTGAKPFATTSNNGAPQGRNQRAGNQRSGNFGDGYVFGVPVGELGWFATLLMGTAAGFAAFFMATFCAIFAILIYNSAAHGSIDYAYSYRRVGLPIGLLVLVVALGYLGTMWVRRILRRA